MTTKANDPLARGLEAAQLWVREVNKANGWFDEDRTFGDDIALLHSELSEALEAYRDFGTADATEMDEDGNWDETCPDCKPLGIGSEFADVLVRLLDTCERYEIDLHGEFIRKMLFNENRGYRHGGKNL